MEVKKDFTEFIELLNNEKVKYVILGGYAVSFHGRPRATGDIDFFYSAEPDNCLRLVRVLERFIGASEMKAENLMARGKITMIGIPPNRIDLVNSVSGINFEDAWEARVAGTYGVVEAWFISREHLMKNKKAANRLKDQVDVQSLEADPPPSRSGSRP